MQLNGEISPRRTWILDGLIAAGKHLPDELRRRILADPSLETTLALIDVIKDEELFFADSAGGGYAPVHAATLLGERRAVEAVEALLDVVCDDDWMALVRGPAIHSLIEIGAPTAEPTFARLERELAARHHRSRACGLAQILAHTGVRDPRYLAILLRVLEMDVGGGASALEGYDDPAALPHLIRAFDACEVKDPDRVFAADPLIKLQAAIEALGGTLTPEQQDQIARADAFTQRLTQRLRATYIRRRPPRPIETQSRNSACSCGSGLKYKKCCLKKEAQAR